MGLFDLLKKGAPANNTYPQDAGSNNTDNAGSVPTYHGTGLLDLEKGGILDLTKFSGSLRNHSRASAGWALNRMGRNYDLDLCAYLTDVSGRVINTVYYGDKNYRGIYLDGDDLNGGGSGDNENIFVNFQELPRDVAGVYFAVVIYEARARSQIFENVRNAYVRLVDDNNCEICRFTMTEGGGDNTALLAAKLYRNGDHWEFKAIGEYSKDTIGSLGKKVSNHLVG